jgi:hypothetical protein
MSALPALLTTEPTDEAPPAALVVFCYRPAGRASASFESRIRRALADLGPGARLVLASSASVRQAPPAGVYLSPTCPTVVVLVAGRLMGQAVGELPLWELRALIAAALGSRRDK